MVSDPREEGRVTAVGTIAAKNYLARVRVLADSLAVHHPQLSLFVMLTDEIEGRFVAVDEPFHLISFAELADCDASLRRLAFTYDRKALAAASKPLLLRTLLNRGYSRVVLVDADTLLLGRMDDVLRVLDDHSILLCPHRLKPPTGRGRADADLGLLRSGTFNAGLVGVRDTPPARSFIDWWRDRLQRHCRNSPEDGLHLDQRWLDLVPGLFPDVGLVRDPGINVGWWNFDERPISIANETETSFFGWLREPAEVAGTESPPITNLWFEIYTRRHDVRQEYPDIEGADRDRFVRWTLTSGVREHYIPEVFRIPKTEIG